MEWQPGGGGCFSGVERPGREPDLSCRSGTEFRNEWSYTSTASYTWTLAFQSPRTVGMCYGVEVCPSTTMWRSYWCKYEICLRRIYMKAFGTARHPPHSFVGTWFSTGYAGTTPRFGWKSSKLLPQLILGGIRDKSLAARSDDGVDHCAHLRCR